MTIEHQMTLELGLIYRVTYDDDTVRKYQIIGGEPPMAWIVSENGTMNEKISLSDIFCNFKTIEKIDAK